MRLTKSKLVLAGIMMAALVVVACALVPEKKPALTLKFQGFKTNETSSGRSYVMAVVAMTNTSRRPVLYRADPSLDFAPDYRCKYLSKAGWHDEILTCIIGGSIHPLAPSQGLVFDAGLQYPEPCKVTVQYSDVSSTNRIYQLLRWSFVGRLLRMKEMPYTAETEVFQVEKTSLE